jgi:hypothetical protein
MPSPAVLPIAFDRSVEAIAIKNGKAAKVLDLNQGTDVTADAS